MATILKTQGLNKIYRLGSFLSKITITALNDVNLTIESDEPVIVSLVGESGSGKITLAKASRRMIIINLFLTLKQQYKTGFLYITHDLATAYYISDYIAVMHRRSIVEFGQAKQVLSDPQHSHTRLLLDSIPTLKRKWVRQPPGAAALMAREIAFASR